MRLAGVDRNAPSGVILTRGCVRCHAGIEAQHFARQIERAADQDARGGVVADGIGNGGEEIGIGFGYQTGAAGGGHDVCRALRAAPATGKADRLDAAGKTGEMRQIAGGILVGREGADQDKRPRGAGFQIGQGAGQRLPGRFIMSAIEPDFSAAGGIGENANWSQVILSRDGEEYRLSLRGIYENGNAAQNVLLRPGDVVNVSRSDDNKVFVLGEVVKPESIPMGRNGMSLAEALSNTGGLDEREADASGIFVFRKAQPGQEHGIDVYQLNAKDAAALVLADSFELQPRDIVYVTAAPLARWNRVLSLLVPSVTALYLGGRAESELGSD